MLKNVRNACEKFGSDHTKVEVLALWECLQHLTNHESSASEDGTAGADRYTLGRDYPVDNTHKLETQITTAGFTLDTYILMFFPSHDPIPRISVLVSSFPFPLPDNAVASFFSQTTNIPGHLKIHQDPLRKQELLRGSSCDQKQSEKGCSPGLILWKPKRNLNPGSSSIPLLAGYLQSFESLSISTCWSYNDSSRLRRLLRRKLGALQMLHGASFT